MTDLETTLRELGEPGSGPAPPAGLADRALRQAHRRGRHRGQLVVAAAVVAVVVVAVGAANVRVDSARDREAPATTARALKPRENVLIIGSDAAPDREGVRPDTVVVASIDTRTGSTVLFGLPRNLEHVPFPAGSPQEKAMPTGYDCPDHACLLNTLWTWAEREGARYYPGDPHAGLTATLQAAEQVTGLEVDQYIVLDMPGLAALVDAVGGVTVNIRERLPVGGSVNESQATRWLEAGRQHLDGVDALWFARSRWTTSDINRMSRQRCLLAALASQVDDTALSTRFPRLLNALKGSLTTSISIKDLPAWTALAGRVRPGPINLIGLATAQPGQPDYPAIHEQVQQAIRAGRTPVGTPPTTDSGGSGTPGEC